MMKKTKTILAVEIAAMTIMIMTTKMVFENKNNKNKDFTDVKSEDVEDKNEKENETKERKDTCIDDSDIEID